MQVARRFAALMLLAILAAVLVPQAARADPSAGPVKYYVVRTEYAGQPEFLFEIAQRFLGSGDRNTEIFELNKGRIQPDGLALTKAEAILPGWVLELPPDAAGDGVQTGLLPTVSGSAPAAPVPAASGGFGWLARTLLIAGGAILLALVGVGCWLWRRDELPPPPFMAGRPPPHAPAAGEPDRVPAAALAGTAILAVAALVAGAVLTATRRASALSTPSSPAAATASTAPTALGPRIGTSNPSLCLAATAEIDGAPLVLRTCDGSPTQRWEAARGGTIRAAGLCMDVAGAAKAVGTVVQLATCNGNLAQQFTFVGTMLVSELTGNCVDVRGQRVAAGVGAVIQPCTSVRDRAWKLLA